MNAARWQEFADRALAGKPLTREEAKSVLRSPPTDFLSLIDAAFRVRREYHGLNVRIHYLVNAKMGGCPEDCGFCSQSSKYTTSVGEEPILSVEQLLEGARKAKAAKAWKYCMVTATRGPSTRDLDVVCEAAERIKSEMDITLCASLGILTPEKAQRLAKAGIDRFNHNLETSERNFPNIVSTHTYQDRVSTVKIAKEAGMETCCGGIVGLKENEDDILDLLYALRELEVDSIPINFLNPRPGTPLEVAAPVEPLYGLKVLALARFLNPKADVRAAGGREVVLRSLQPFVLYAANSIFTSGYLTTAGAAPSDDHRMILDLGFTIQEVVEEHADECDEPHASAEARA
ncbi:MAG: biotin synthase BioB [Bdellovibrionota bacterium]